LNTNLEKVNPKSRQKLKWKTVEELVRYKRDIVHYFLENIPNLYLQFGKGWRQNWRMSKAQFHKLLVWGGFCETHDTELTEKFLYTCDDENLTETIDYRELLTS